MKLFYRHFQTEKYNEEKEKNITPLTFLNDPKIEYAKIRYKTDWYKIRKIRMFMKAYDSCVWWTQNGDLLVGHKSKFIAFSNRVAQKRANLKNELSRRVSWQRGEVSKGFLSQSVSKIVKKAFEGLSFRVSIFDLQKYESSFSDKSAVKHLCKLILFLVRWK